MRTRDPDGCKSVSQARTPSSRCSASPAAPCSTPPRSAASRSPPSRCSRRPSPAPRTSRSSSRAPTTTASTPTGAGQACALPPASSASFLRADGRRRRLLRRLIERLEGRPAPQRRLWERARAPGGARRHRLRDVPRHHRRGPRGGQAAGHRVLGARRSRTVEPRGLQGLARIVRTPFISLPSPPGHDALQDCSVKLWTLDEGRGLLAAGGPLQAAKPVAELGEHEASVWAVCAQPGGALGGLCSPGPRGVSDCKSGESPLTARGAYSRRIAHRVRGRGWQRDRVGPAAGDARVAGHGRVRWRCGPGRFGRREGDRRRLRRWCASPQDAAAAGQDIGWRGHSPLGNPPACAPVPADQLRLLDARCVGGEAAAASLGGDSARCVSVSGLTAVAGTDAGGLAVWDLSASAPGVIGKPVGAKPKGSSAALRWCAPALSMRWD